MTQSSRACQMVVSCTYIERASSTMMMPVFLYRKSNKQLNVLRFCCAQIVTLLRVADTSGLCIDGLVFSDTRSEFMQNELTAMQTRNTLLRAESAECGFSSVAKNKITVMDDRRNEQG